MATEKRPNTILIVGGYGTFGGRLVELLEGEPALTLIIAGRSLDKAMRYCGGRTAAKATLTPARFDRDGDLAAQLSKLAPDILVDASGPFQDYGDNRYRLVEAAIAAGVDYLDLADGAGFVAGVAAFDAAAKAAGTFVLAGASSFPVLTGLVVRELAAGMASVETIRGGIAPSPYAGVGENVIRAIAGYAGQPVPVIKDGAPTVGHPFTEGMRYTVAPPGRMPLRNILFSLVDVPDLRVLPQIRPDAKTVWVGAGPVPEGLHRALIGFAWLVRWRVLPSLTPMVGLIRLVMNHIRWGEHRGGMFVEITGRDETGGTARKSWHLLAEGSDGPLIPSMAVEAVVRRLMKGDTIPPGARTPIDDLVLADYDALFARRTIVTGFRQDEPEPAGPLYRRLLGSAWDELPEAIRAMHDIADAAEARGAATVERGTNPLANLVANLVGFPKAATNIPVSVAFARDGRAERWTRTFAGKPFASLQYAGRGRNERLLVERFGPLAFAMALVLEDARLRLVLRRWTLLGLPMPMWLCPRSDSHETAGDGRFHFHVDISHPLLGRIVRYEGWLERTG